MARARPAAWASRRMSAGSPRHDPTAVLAHEHESGVGRIGAPGGAEEHPRVAPEALVDGLQVDRLEQRRQLLADPKTIASYLGEEVAQ